MDLVQLERVLKQYANRPLKVRPSLPPSLPPSLLPSSLSPTFTVSNLTSLPPSLPPSFIQIGAFTAASNITGLCVDVDAVTGLLHKYGALAFWDYATAAPYLKVLPPSLPPSLLPPTMASSYHPFSPSFPPSLLPSLQVDMNPMGGFDANGQALDLRKDAIFISGHKFVGGPGMSLPPSLPPCFPPSLPFSHLHIGAQVCRWTRYLPPSLPPC